MRLVPLIALGAALTAAPASAEVKSAGPTGFELESIAEVPVSPAEAYAALGRVGEWWSAAHSYSGDAVNLTLPLRAGECFCEAIPIDRGSVEHGRVLLAWPGRMLRVQGGLGPLQAEAALGVLTWTFEPTERGARITQNYVVGGALRGGGEAMAPLVDHVMSLQLEGLRAHLARE